MHIAEAGNGGFAGVFRFSSIVGYTAKEAAKGKFIILGVQFEGVQGGTKINDLISGVTGVDWDADLNYVLTAPQIQVPAASGYTTYYYLNDGWYDDGTEDGATKAGWCDSEGAIVDDELTPGVAMWAKSVGDDASINVAGAVSEDDSADIDCPATFALRANIFPVSAQLNTSAMTATGISGVDWDADLNYVLTAPQIQVPAASGYTTYYYLNDGWYDDGTEDGATKAGWCDSEGAIVNDAIPAAQGFWTKGVGSAFKLVFSK